MKLLSTRIIIGILVVIIIGGFAHNTFSQTVGTSNVGKSILQTGMKPQTALKSMSLLDPERFTMRNQYIMNFSSVGGSGSLMGMFINTMEYRFNSPLIMRLKVAYQSKTGQLFGDKNMYSGNPNLENGRVFIPSFDIIYKPWKNTTFSFHYRDYSTSNPYYGYGGYGRYGYSPYMRY